MAQVPSESGVQVASARHEPMETLSGLAFQERFAGILAQPAIRKSIPAFLGLGALAAAGTLYLSVAGAPNRILYSSLSDTERGQVVEALEGAGIDYAIDNGTGIISVPEDDLYRARMTVASDGALAAPESGSAMLDSMPLGVSRTLEGERLRLARERELMLTIKEIDGIEAVRVHLATPERSVFVRKNTAPSASVLIRLAKGRSLSKSQVDAIVNLVSGSVPGLEEDAVRVVDQNGRLLSAKTDDVAGGLALRRDFESKLQSQLAGLLLPLLGEGNFSTEVQVELNRAESTSARESYDKEGVVKSETESSASRRRAGSAGGVPGVLANTPPPPTALEKGAPRGTKSTEGTEQGDSESSARRDYALGREVSVTSSRPGGIERISVAVVVNEEALKRIAPADEEKIKSLVEAAAGIDPNRGDQATVVVGKFEPVTLEEPPFYETSWFAMVLRYGGGFVALLLAFFLGVRPLLKILRAHTIQAGEDNETDSDDNAENVDFQHDAKPAPTFSPNDSASRPALNKQVALARKLAIEQPDRAVAALQRMLASPVTEDSQ